MGGIRCFREVSLHHRVVVFPGSLTYNSIDALKAGLPTAQFLHRAIYRTGTSLINKKQIKHLRAFRMCVVKDGPDVSLFAHPAALTKLSLWVGEALAEQEKEVHGKLSHGGRGTPLVVASLNEKRGVYIVVGTGGGGGGPDTTFLDRATAKQKKSERETKLKKKEESRLAKQKIREEKRAARRDAGEDDDEQETESEESDGSDSGLDSDDEDTEREKGYGLNKFGSAFQDVVSETNARVRIDSFEHCVVEVKKEDLGGFLESLSMKAVVG